MAKFGMNQNYQNRMDINKSQLLCIEQERILWLFLLATNNHHLVYNFLKIAVCSMAITAS
jgi:hypothetical protein